MNKRRKINTGKITRIALCVAFLIIGAWISTPTHPPVTLQTVSIFIIATLLSPLNSFITVLVYLLLGIIGIPVFSSFTGGIGIIMSVSGGFLISFLIIAPLVSLMLSKFRTSVFTSAFIFTLATLITYICGATWIQLFKYHTGSFKEMFAACILPFFVFDPFKIAIATFATVKLKKIFKNHVKKN